MDRKLRNRISLLLLLAVVVAVGLIKLSGRKPAPKISAVTPVRENLISSISSNGKVEPIAPYVMRAELDTFVEKVYAREGQQVKKGQLLLELDVKDVGGLPKRARSCSRRRMICGPPGRAERRTRQRRSWVTWQKRRRSATGCRKITLPCSISLPSKRRREMS